MEDKHVFMPLVDIIEMERSFELYADMPGIDSQKLNESLSVEMENGILNISGIISNGSKQLKSSQNEFFRGEFHRNIKFDENLISSDITGKYSNGVLHITLPKKKEEKQKVAIKSFA